MSLLSELYTPYGDANGDPSEPFADILHLMPKDVVDGFKKQAKKDGIDSYDWMYFDGYNAKFTKELKSWLKSLEVWSKGELFVSRILPNSREILYFLFDGSEKMLDDALLGVIQTKETEGTYSSVKLGNFYNLSGEEVHWSNVRTKGQGHGAMLYDAVLEYTGVLFSDNTLFQGSFAMWTNHMAKKAFLGCIVDPGLGDTGKDDVKYIIPMDVRNINDVWVEENLDRFVVVNDRSVLPKTVRRLEYNTRGIDPVTELLIVKFKESFVFKNQYVINGEKTHKGYTVEDYLDNFTSIPEWVDSMEGDSDLNKFTYEKVNFQDFVTESYDGVKLAIVSCDDVVLLLKNSNDGISVQILD